MSFLYLRKSGVATFADIIKIVTIFIKTIFEDSKKVKKIRNYVSKSISAFFNIAKFLISGEKTVT